MPITAMSFSNAIASWLLLPDTGIRERRRLTSQNPPLEHSTPSAVHHTELPSARRSDTPQAAVRVSIIIVNYCSAPLTLACLESLAAERDGDADFDVVVVENDSPDDSYGALSEGIAAQSWGEWVSLERSSKNGGFAYGVNTGVRAGLSRNRRPDAFLLLNPDTYLRPRALDVLTDTLRADPDLGIVGSRLEDPDGTQQHSRFRFPNIGNQFADGLRVGFVHQMLGDLATCPPLVDKAHDIDWLAGASMLIRREVFERVGLFDEDFFLYFEELDFTRRAAAAGWRTRYAPDSKVVHLVGQSTGVTARHARPGRTPSYWFESRNRYFRKHHSPAYKLAADAAFMLGRSAHHVLRVLRGRRNEDPPRYLWDFLRHSWLPGHRGARPASEP